MDLPARVEKNLSRRALLAPGDSVLVAVSGGLDSMVLLHLLQSVRDKGGFHLAVAHFNHRLRGAESDGDEAFVRSAASKAKLPFQSGGGDVQQFARSNRVSIEMAARALRHEFLSEAARALGCGQIALAHHLDDQVETFWLRLLRGDVGVGLAGMRWKRPGERPGIFIVRPLLDIPKSDLASYAGENRISFRTDRSNADRSHLRNRLRLEVLPRLQEFQPALVTVSSRAAEVLGAEKAYLESEAQRWLFQRIVPFSSLHVALQREIIRIQLLQLDITPSFERIEALLLPSQLVEVSPGKAAFRNDSGEVEIRDGSDSPHSNPQFCSDRKVIPVEDGGSVVFADVCFSWDVVDARGPAESGMEYFDATSIGPVITLRHWVPGDRFQPIGLSQAAKLQDLFTNLKIPAGEKRARIVAVAESGSIFWVEGLRISEQHKVLPESAKVLRWGWRKSP